MVNKPQRTSEQQEYRNKLAQTLRDLRARWNKNLAETLLERHKNTAEYISADKRISWQSENKEKLSNFSLEHQIENYLMSQEFENYFLKLDFDGREFAIWAVIMYTIAFQDETKPIDYSDCMEFIKFNNPKNHWKINDKLIELIGRRLWIKEWDCDYEEKMREYIYNKIYINWYVFHAFNSAFEKSIRKYGLSTSIHTTPEEEVRELWLLMRKYNESFDFYYVNWKDSERICFDYSTDHIWDHANKSPEWFWCFIYIFKKYHYWYWNMPDRDAKVQYEELIDGMNKFFEIRNVSKEDQIRIKELFDKNRKLYWIWEPRLAMIKLQSVDEWYWEDFDLDDLQGWAFDLIDCSVNRDIPIEDIKIVHFPKNLKP